MLACQIKHQVLMGSLSGFVDVINKPLRTIVTTTCHLWRTVSLSLLFLPAAKQTGLVETNFSFFLAKLKKSKIAQTNIVLHIQRWPKNVG